MQTIRTFFNKLFGSEKEETSLIIDGITYKPWQKSHITELDQMLNECYEGRIGCDNTCGSGTPHPKFCSHQKQTFISGVSEKEFNGYLKRKQPIVYQSWQQSQITQLDNMWKESHADKAYAAVICGNCYTDTWHTCCCAKQRFMSKMTENEFDAYLKKKGVFKYKLWQQPHTTELNQMWRASHSGKVALCVCCGVCGWGDSVACYCTGQQFMNKVTEREFNSYLKKKTKN